MDKHIWEIESASTMSDNDRLLIVINTKEYLIKKSDFQKLLGGLSSTDTAKLSKIIIDGDGSRVLANNGEYISLADLYKNEHNHDNKAILDKFTIDTETKHLLYDGEEIASAYELPVATTEVLGGVKVDGSTITIDDNGVISGASTYELPVATDTTLGGVKIDNDTIKINDGVISTDVIGNWSSEVSYPVGYFVVYDSGLWECMVANTDAVWTPSHWMPVAYRVNYTYSWMTKYSYLVNQCVIYNQNLYRCTTDHTSGDTFDETYWELIGNRNDTQTITITDWTANTEYVVGNLVIKGTIIYQCHTAHTSGETFDTTNWTAMSGEKGEKGDNGVTPHIDETTKHWMIGEEDTGVIAEAVSTVITNAVVYSGTLNVDNWVGDTVPYTQEVTMSGITADSRPFLFVSYSSDNVATILEEQKQWGYITRAVTSDNVITFYCYKDKPTIALNFEAEVR